VISPLGWRACVWWGILASIAPGSATAAERMVFCEAQSEACAMDDGSIIGAARAGKPVPAILYESKAAYEEAIAGLRGKEVEAAILQRLRAVRAGATAAAPQFLFGVVRDDMQDVIRAAGPGSQATVDRTLAAAAALAGGAERFKDLSPGECVTKARDSVARLRAVLKEGPSAAGYAREAERLRALLEVLRPHNADRAPLPDLEQAYFVPDEHPPGIRGEMFADHPWYGWRGGTVRLFRTSETAKPVWRGKLRLMYFDRATFVGDITSLTGAQMNRRLSAWLNGPPPEAVGVLASRLAFDHAVEMRQCTVPQTAEPLVPAAWTEMTNLSLDNLRLALRTAGQKRAPALRPALDRLRADATLLSVLVHAGPTPSPIVPAVDRFQAALEALKN
jgi:hypothetical protein